MPTIAQLSFSGGELSPTLRSRSDLAKYKTGAAKMQNMLVHPHGGAFNRPGLRFIGAVPDSTKKSRVVPFYASTNDTYVLEFTGQGHMRVIRNGGFVLSPGTPYYYAQPHPYVDDEIFQLRFEQSNDVMTIVHPSRPIIELTRYDHADWRFTIADFTPDAPGPSAIVIDVVETSDATDQYPVHHQYAVTAVGEDGRESLPVLAPSDAPYTDLRYYPYNTNVLNWLAVPNAMRYNVYKKDNGIFGLLGSTKETQFIDKNIKPALSDGPPADEFPFDGVGRYPRAVAFFQQRRIFGGTNLNPQTFWGTQSGDYRNMNVAIPAKDSDAFEFTLASRKRQRINHIVPLEDLIIFTPNSEWRVTGGQGPVVTPNSVNARVQSEYGSSDVPPIVIGSQILFVQAKGSTVRDLQYSVTADRYSGNDLSVLSKHLFKGRAIREWAYAQEPHSVIWCVMDDGSILSLTYMREHEVWAWSRHQTQGIAESVCVVPEGGQDVPYFVIRRFVNGSWMRYVERLATRDFEDVEDCIFVDSALTYDDPRNVTMIVADPATIIYMNAAGYTVGDQIEIAGVVSYKDTDGNWHGFFGPQGQSINGRYRVQATDGNAYIRLADMDGVAFSTEGWGFSYSNREGRAPDPLAGMAGTTESELFTLGWGNAGKVRRAVSVLNGAEHLAGLRVSMLVDGEYAQTTVSVGGAIDLPFAACRVHVGLPYVSELETLNIELALKDGSQIGKHKKLNNVVISIDRSRDIEIGSSWTSLTTMKPREKFTPSGARKVVTEDLPITPFKSSDKWGRVCIRQRRPLPMDILSVVPDYEFVQDDRATQAPRRRG